MSSPATTAPRPDGRAVDELRPITITRGWSRQAEGSALIEFGNTRVLCTASFTEGVPRWLKGEGTGWVSAEYANYRRRTERERGELANTAKAKFATQLLPLLDDLDLAEQHGDLSEGPMKAFADKFRAIVSGQGITEFGAEGDEFNPEIHEAVQDLSQGDTKVVGTVLRKGYRLRGRVVRSAMVVIGDPAAEE